jgi:hypothetical protein
VVTYAHFAANAFAILLFAVGTHAVQLLLSPTRAEVEIAAYRCRRVEEHEVDSQAQIDKSSCSPNDFRDDTISVRCCQNHKSRLTS